MQTVLSYKSHARLLYLLPTWQYSGSKPLKSLTIRTLNANDIWASLYRSGGSIFMLTSALMASRLRRIAMLHQAHSSKCSWGWRGLKLSGIRLRDLVNGVASGDLLDCLQATDCLYGHTASDCSCYYQPQGATPCHVSIMGYSLSFSRLDVRLNWAVIS